MFFNIFFIVSIVGKPLISNGKLQGGIRIRKHRDPFIGMDRSPVIQIRADIDALDPQFGEPIAKKRRHFHTESKRSYFRVAAPEEESVTVLCHIRDQICLRRHFAYRFAAPDMFCAPVPAFPGIHISHLLGITAGQGEHTVRTSVRRSNILSFPMHIGFTEDRFRCIGLIDPLDLIGTDLRSFFPGDPFITADPACLRMTFSFRIPVDPLHRIQDAVRRIDPGFIAKAHVGNVNTFRRVKGFAPCFHMPGITVRIGIFLVIGIGIDPDDLSVFTVNFA